MNMPTTVRLATKTDIKQSLSSRCTADFEPAYDRCGSMLLKKSPRSSCGIETRNDQLTSSDLFNRYFAHPGLILIQSCLEGPTKSFFDSIGQIRSCKLYPLHDRSSTKSGSRSAILLCRGSAQQRTSFSANASTVSATHSVLRVDRQNRPSAVQLCRPPRGSERSPRLTGRARLAMEPFPIGALSSQSWRKRRAPRSRRLRPRTGSPFVG